MRVLKWMVERVEGTAGGVENVFGVTPQFDDLSWDGIDFTAQQFDTITSVDNAAWREEVTLHTELFARLHHRLPQELVDAKAQLEQRLAQ